MEFIASNANELFIEKARIELVRRKMNIKQLAERIQRNYASVRGFMCGAFDSDLIRNDIAKELGIE